MERIESFAFQCVRACHSAFYRAFFSHQQKHKVYVSTVRSQKTQWHGKVMLILRLASEWNIAEASLHFMAGRWQPLWLSLSLYAIKSTSCSFVFLEFAFIIFLFIITLHRHGIFYIWPFVAGSVCRHALFAGKTANNHCLSLHSYISRQRRQFRQTINFH